MKKCLPIFLFLFMTTIASAQVVINEISYNPPESGQDSLEYIELHNLGDAPVDLSMWAFTAGVDLTFDSDISIDANGYLIVCESASAMMNVFGVEGIVWDGGMSNGGESITLTDANGAIVDDITFDDAAPWPSEDEGTDGGGASIELCDATSDNADGANWRAANNDIGVVINGNSVLGTPGAANTVTCTIEPDYTVNAMGLSFSPADITIQLGETVRWENTGGSHNVNGGLDVYPNNPEGIFSGAPEAAPWTWDYTFTIPGVYDYQCDLHVGAGMVGTVTVEGEIEPPLPLVITEIMYNDPGTEDSLEFVEMVNLSDTPINLEGLSFSSGIIHTFAAQELAPGELVVLSKYPDILMNRLGISSIAWTEGTLSDGGELLEIVNVDGAVVDAVMYDDEGDWSEMADGNGTSLVLCNPVRDNNVASNWGVSTYDADIDVNGVNIFINPGTINFCQYTVAGISETNADGQIVFEGPARVLGRALGVNLRPSGLQFTITDELGEGIALFSGGDNFGYDEVVEGDLLYVEGQVVQFNGLTQLALFDVDLVSTDGPTPSPTVVTALGEDTESQLVTLENVFLVESEEWSGTGPGFNVRVTDGGPDTFTVRIDNDVDLYNRGYPQGTFSVTGVGGQFDNSVPYTDGYQLLPRYKEDISPYDEFVIEFPEYDIPTVTTVDADGVADSIDVKVSLTGIAHGINWRPSGLQFWLIDEDNNGIQVFNFTGDVGYTVTEGDRLVVDGTIDQFNGLIEIIPSEITVVESGVSLVDPTIIASFSALEESLESKYVSTSIEPYSLVDPTQWAGDGSSFSFDVINGSSTFTVFVDADTEFANMLTPPGALLAITGIVSQNDSESPFDSDYSIWVRYADDLQPVVNVINTTDSDDINLFPNPAQNVLSIDTELDIERVEVLNYTGKLISAANISNGQVDISSLVEGAYFIRLTSGDNQYIHRFVKM